MPRNSKKDGLVPIKSDDLFSGVIPQKRRGVFEDGTDKLGRPYEKKYDEDGVYTKKEILKDGTKKLTIKKKP